MKKRIAFLLALVMIVSCLVGVTSADTVKTNKLELQGKIMLYTGFVTQWKANKAVTWASGNPAVASVNSCGYITAHRPGQANITATAANGEKKTVLLTVKNPNTYYGKRPSTNPYIVGKDIPAGIYFTNSADVLMLGWGNVVWAGYGIWEEYFKIANGEKIAFSYGDIMPLEALPLIPMGTSYSFSGSWDKDTFIAGIDFPSGEYVIKNIDANWESYYHVNGDEYELSVGQTKKITLEEYTEIEFGSDIVAWYAGVVPTDIALAGKTSIKVGTETFWTARALPDNATNMWISWTSGNPGVATVGRDGRIVGHKPGQANITAMTSNGVKKTVLITVVQ